MCMGIVGSVLNDILEKIEDLTIFIISYTLFIFVAGEWFGIYFKGKEAFWYPLYLLFFVILIKILLDFGRSGKKKK